MKMSPKPYDYWITARMPGVTEIQAGGGVFCDDCNSLTLSAEHATIELTAPRPIPGVGDHVEFVAGYADSTVFLHDHIYGFRNGRLEVIWPILGRGKTE